MLVGVALSVTGAVTMFATVSGIGMRGQVEINVYGVGFLFAVRALYEVTNLGE